MFSCNRNMRPIPGLHVRWTVNNAFLMRGDGSGFLMSPVLESGKRRR